MVVVVVVNESNHHQSQQEPNNNNMDHFPLSLAVVVVVDGREESRPRFWGGLCSRISRNSVSTVGIFYLYHLLEKIGKYRYDRRIILSGTCSTYLVSVSQSLSGTYLLTTALPHQENIPSAAGNTNPPHTHWLNHSTCTHLRHSASNLSVSCYISLSTIHTTTDDRHNILLIYIYIE